MVLGCKIDLIGEITFAKIKLGFGYLTYPTSSSVLKIGGRLIFAGCATILNGFDLNVMGQCFIGKNFICNPNCKIDVKASVTFGDNVLIGPECYFSDDDGHPIYNNSDKNRINDCQPILIGNNVWIGRGVYILKGTKLDNNNIVGARSVLTKEFNGKNLCLAGNPARIVRQDVYWTI